MKIGLLILSLAVGFTAHGAATFDQLIPSISFETIPGFYKGKKLVAIRSGESDRDNREQIIKERANGICALAGFKFALYREQDLIRATDYYERIKGSNETYSLVFTTNQKVIDYQAKVEVSSGGFYELRDDYLMPSGLNSSGAFFKAITCFK